MRVWNTAKERIAIPSESLIGQAGDEVAASRGRAAAAIAVLGLAAGVAALPAVVALGAGTETLARMAVGLGSLVVVVGGVKLAAAAWGAAASID
ncbi:MAG TPA: hypothetical protein VJP81_07870 [Candidatus Dormibacteraeota bacterium]|nr:hypothetical protein [Candidatus Dormibacteraeota bacterium]